MIYIYINIYYILYNNNNNNNMINIFIIKSTLNI